MFCNSKNDPDEVRPNVNVCPVCMAHPGTLPVVNHEAVKHVLTVGAALSGTLADYTEFDRKNYFYPDLPKGYQISQYEYPLVSGGTLNDVSITRVHLEEDTAKSQHAEGEYSVVDFNRAGIPLMELVTEPVIHDSKTARAFAEELQRLLRAVGAGEANMEKGQMRVEANISVSKDAALGTKVEVKNLNSFKAVERAIEYEIARQIELLESGGKVVQETRGWDENKAETFSQRLKEESHDYRYFPDPDIPKFRLSRIAEFSLENLFKSMPELPWQRRARYLGLGLKDEDANTLVDNPNYAAFFDTEIASADPDTLKLAANYLMTDVRGGNCGAEELERLSKGAFLSLISLVRGGKLSSRGAKEVLAVLMKDGGDPEGIATAQGLMQMQDMDAIARLADEIISENQAVAEQVRSGKGEAMKFLLGQGMKKSKGSANPAELERILREKLTPLV
jgi:aspartyl-tRNA(Asn)/glutamyl-tRNA(Gln) amidotransferase subunit B